MDICDGHFPALVLRACHRLCVFQGLALVESYEVFSCLGLVEASFSNSDWLITLVASVVTIQMGLWF